MIELIFSGWKGPDRDERDRDYRAVSSNDIAKAAVCFCKEYPGKATLVFTGADTVYKL